MTLVGIAALATVGVSTAEASSPSLLNALEVRQLVAQSAPDAHARLAAHFATLADRYDAQAVRDAAVAKVMGGNPNRRMAIPVGSYWIRHADANAESAVTLRALAAHYRLLAGGISSRAPLNSGRFMNGFGAPAPTDQELAIASGTARTAVEHAVLVEYFLSEADRHVANAEQHATRAQAYRVNANQRTISTAMHCDRMASAAREARNKARRNAADHGRFAPFA
jgi:nitroreductase